jgi:hypothetical protein
LAQKKLHAGIFMIASLEAGDAFGDELLSRELDGDIGLKDIAQVI